MVAEAKIRARIYLREPSYNMDAPHTSDLNYVKFPSGAACCFHRIRYIVETGRLLAGMGVFGLNSAGTMLMISLTAC